MAEGAATPFSKELSTLDGYCAALRKALLAGDGEAAASAARSLAASGSCVTVKLQAQDVGQSSAAVASPAGAAASRPSTPGRASATLSYAREEERRIDEKGSGRAARHAPGECVEYWSKSANRWIPAVVKAFDEASCTYCLDVQSMADPMKVRSSASFASCSQAPHESRRDGKPSDAQSSSKSPSASTRYAQSSAAAFASASCPTGKVQPPDGHRASGADDNLFASTRSSKSPVRQHGQDQKQQARPDQQHQKQQHFANGTAVEYFSTTHNQWLAAVVKSFDASNGSYVLDIQPVALPSKVRAAEGANATATGAMASATAASSTTGRGKAEGVFASSSAGGRDSGGGSKSRTSTSPTAASATASQKGGRGEIACGICHGRFPLDSLLGPGACRHHFCHRCLRDHVKKKDFLRERVNCPSCESVMTVLEVKHAVGEQDYAARQAQMAQEDAELARKMSEQMPPAGPTSSARRQAAPHHSQAGSAHEKNMSSSMSSATGSRAAAAQQQRRRDTSPQFGAGGRPRTPPHGRGDAAAASGGPNASGGAVPGAGGSSSSSSGRKVLASALVGAQPHLQTTSVTGAEGGASSSSKSKPCKVCGSSFLASELRGPLACQHQSCKPCLLRHVISVDFVRHAVKCPVAGCSLEFNAQQVQHIVGLPEYQKRCAEVDEQEVRKLSEQLAREEVEQQPKANGFDCPLCFDHVSIDEAVQLDCDHKLCRSCFSRYLESKIMEAQVAENELVCPIPKCGCAITVPQVQGAMNGTPLWEKFLQFRMNSWQPASGGIVDCPKPDCDRFIAPADMKFVQCPTCKKEFCKECKGDKHEGISCEALKAWKAQNENADNHFEELMAQQLWRRCPVCGVPSERESGCNFMQCNSQYCRRQTYWCYICGKQFPKEDHYRHYPHGPYENECLTPESEYVQRDVAPPAAAVGDSFPWFRGFLQAVGAV